MEMKSEPHEREYVRHKVSGNLGYVFVDPVSGETKVRLDRASEVIEQKYDQNLWEPDERQRPWTRHQAAKVAFEAHRALCMLQGRPAEARKTWLDLSQTEAASWARNGPGDGLNGELFSAIMTTLEPKIQK